MNHSVMPNPPQDSVSSLAMNADGSALVAGSWDNSFRFWTIDRSRGVPQGNFRGQITHQGPVLCCDFNSNNTECYSGGADNQVLAWDLNTGSQKVVGTHQAPVSCMQFLPELNVLVTGGWDKRLCFWDTRSPRLALGVDLPERAYSLSAFHPYLTVACAASKLQIFSIQNQPSLIDQRDPRIKYVIRKVCMFPDRERPGYAVSSVEGRVSISYIHKHDQDAPNDRGNFVFKCHRDVKQKPGKVFAVNDVAFNRYGTFATIGGDGYFHFWDKDGRTRLKNFTKHDQPLTCGKFNANSDLFAYAVGYDWSQGQQGYNQNAPIKICVRPCTQQELEKKKKK